MDSNTWDVGIVAATDKDGLDSLFSTAVWCFLVHTSRVGCVIRQDDLLHTHELSRRKLMAVDLKTTSRQRRNVRYVIGVELRFLCECPRLS